MHVSEGSIYRATFRVRSFSKTVTLFVVSAGDSHVSSSDRPDFEFFSRETQRGFSQCCVQAKWTTV